MTRPRAIAGIVGVVRRWLLDVMLRLDPRSGERVAQVLGRVRLAARLGPRRDAGLALALERARRAFVAGDLHGARAGVDRVYRVLPGERRVRTLRGDVLLAQDDLVELARLQHGTWVAAPTDRGAGVALRLTLGRLAATTPGWLPRVPGPARPVDPTGGVPVLWLVPAVTPGAAVGEARSAPTGEVRSAGAHGVPVYQIGSVVTCPADVPLDVRLEHEAWLAARVARSARPAVLHVAMGTHPIETALVGLAVREHVRRPLVYEVERLVSSSDGEGARREFDVETRALAAADHVIVPSESMRDGVVDRGVPLERVTVMPAQSASDDALPADAARAAAILGALYRDLEDRWDASRADA